MVYTGKMNRNILLSGLIIFMMVTVNAQTSFYDFTVEDINGKDYPLSQLKGKKVLVVNTASKCGLTPQYEGLQELYETGTRLSLYALLGAGPCQRSQSSQ